MSKKFVGNVKAINTQYGELIKIGISQQDFEKYQKNGWVNCLLKKGKEGKYYLELDEFVPEKKETGHVPKNEGQFEVPKESDDLPF